MAHLDQQNPFQAWVLSQEEIIRGQVLTTLQKQVIQNERAALANKRISLKFDPAEPLKFQQEDAELQGQIGILSYLLEMSSAAETIINQGRQSEIHLNSQE